MVISESEYDGTLVGQITKRDEAVVVGLREFRGTEYIDIRTYYEADSGTWRPTKKGVTVPLRAYTEFAEILAQLDGSIGSSRET